MDINKTDVIDGSARSIMDARMVKKWAEKKQMLERKLTKNTLKMEIIKKSKSQCIVFLSFFIK